MAKQKKEYWLESRWSLNKTELEPLQIQLNQLGCLGCYENLDLDEDIEAHKTATELIAYFADTPSLDRFANRLKPLVKNSIKLIVIKKIPQGRWATEWKKYFKPFFLTKNVVIRPSWEKYQTKGTETVITLDPGMSFGTGLHDTTRFCAELICDIKEKHPNYNSLIDVGCGSGILSIIARRIGFDVVTGIDIDPEAIETAFENLERNPQAKPMNLYVSKEHLSHPLTRRYDVVVANIIAETICELKEDLLNLLNPKGVLILSGIITENEKLIKKTFKTLKLLDQKTSKDWHAYIYCKK